MSESKSGAGQPGANEIHGRRRSLVLGCIITCMGLAGIAAVQRQVGVDKIFASANHQDAGTKPTVRQPVFRNAIDPFATSDRVRTDHVLKPAQVGPAPVPVRAAPAQAAKTPLDLDTTPAAIEDRLFASVKYLASDDLEGRGVRTNGLELAAAYIADEFKNAELDTDLFEHGPFQQFPLYSRSRKGYVQQIQFSLPGYDFEPLTRGNDFTALTASPQGTFSLSAAFVGYGITAPEMQYDDYAGINVRGKAVVILRHEPPQFQLEAASPDAVSPDKEHTPHAYVQTKIANAIAHGAAAVIFCTDAPHFERQTFSRAVNDESSENSPVPQEMLLHVEFEERDVADAIPVVHVRRTIVEQLLTAAKSRPLAEIESEIRDNLRPTSFLLNHAAVAGNVDIVRGYRNLKNVVASLPGRGPRAEEVIIVGAHYDHLGRETWGSLSLNAGGEIHNGADDNASGTSVLLEVARQLSARSEPLGRRVLFMAFSAEELGLIGSKRYVQDPLVPLVQTVAMLNLDMVGRLRNGKLTVYGAETSARWPELLSAVAPGELRIFPKNGGYGPSDHASFYEHGVPVLHFFTGFHPQYHRPEDDFDLVNVEGMRQIADYVVDIVEHVAALDSLDRAPATSLELDLTGLDLSELDTAATAHSTAKLGISVENAESPPGVRIVRIHEGGFADRHGFRAGDVITSINGQQVTTTEALQELFREHLSTADIAVRLNRGGIDAEITLRPGGA